MSDYEKEHAMEVLITVNDYILAMRKVYKLADENNWNDLAAELDDKLDLMESRSRQLLKEVVNR